MIIKLKVEGVEYEWDGDRLLVAEARELKVHTGFTPGRWLAAVDEGDPDALAALIYLAKKRAGETLRFSDLDTLDYADFDLKVADPEDTPAGGQPGDQPEAQAVDPTPVSGETGTTPTAGITPSSEPSPTTSSTAPVMSAI